MTDGEVTKNIPLTSAVPSIKHQNKPMNVEGKRAKRRVTLMLESAYQ